MYYYYRFSTGGIPYLSTLYKFPVKDSYTLYMLKSTIKKPRTMVQGYILVTGFCVISKLLASTSGTGTIGNKESKEPSNEHASDNVFAGNAFHKLAF